MPATDPAWPFFEHAPSVYTISSVVTEGENLRVLNGPVTGRDLDTDRSVGVDSTVDDDEGTGTSL